MKKVRFESLDRSDTSISMDSIECHSPRPIITKQIEVNHNTLPYSFPRMGELRTNPVDYFDNSNSSPYPVMNKTSIRPQSHNIARRAPSNDLELSMLDSSVFNEKRRFQLETIPRCGPNVLTRNNSPQIEKGKLVNENMNVLKSVENEVTNNPSNVLSSDNGFFIRPGAVVDTFLHRDLIEKKYNKFNGKEVPTFTNTTSNPHIAEINIGNMERVCTCHHCLPKEKENVLPVSYSQHHTDIFSPKCFCTCTHSQNLCSYTTRNQARLNICDNNVGIHTHHVEKPACNQNNCCGHTVSSKPCNAVDKKTQAIEKYEKSKAMDQSDNQNQGTERSVAISKPDSEPTVADLYKIIKLQNEQLQLLQAKVDNFITNNTKENQSIQPSSYENCSRTEQITLETLNENHKISIGVMTSFEMVRASTFINKELTKQQNAQIQCNTSQLSIKEVKRLTPTQNFLEGITPINKHNENMINFIDKEFPVQNGNIQEDKTVNDLSLCNLQIDNATTPQLSPDQTLYLDVRDYSDSDDENTNVGWTYYNKVMTRVNGLLQDSDMPSSASAMYRNAGRCLQMQIDKSNVSVTKRVTFGDNTLRNNNVPTNTAPTTDTSVKMNQLAAKYLKNTPAMIAQPSKPYSNVDMSFATRNYMEKHQLLNDAPAPGKPQFEMPRFLDITALKQQPKLL